MNRWVSLTAAFCAPALVGCGGANCDKILPLDGDPVVGEFVYVNRCQSCHGPTGEGISGPSLVERLPSLTSCDIVEAVRGGPGSMPEFGADVIDDQDLSDLIEYVTLTFQ